MIFMVPPTQAAHRMVPWKHDHDSMHRSHSAYMLHQLPPRVRRDLMNLAIAQHPWSVLLVVIASGVFVVCVIIGLFVGFGVLWGMVDGTTNWSYGARFGVGSVVVVIGASALLYFVINAAQRVAFGKYLDRLAPHWQLSECPQCKYSTRGCSTRTCPECGCLAVFEPSR